MRTLLPRLSVALLGGTGFVGRHLAARLVRDGHDVTVLTRNRERHRDLLVLPTLRLIQGNPYDLPTLQAAFAGCDAVVNLVTLPSRRGRHGAGYRRAHVDSTTVALAACRAGGPQRYVQMSALKAAVDAPSEFLRTKGEADARVRDSGLDWTILRPSVVFGRDDRFINLIERYLRVLPVLPLPRANTRLAPIYVGDAASAVVRALRDPGASGRTFQLCGPRVYSIRELVELIAAATGRRRPVWPLSPTMGRLLARCLDFVPGSPFSSDDFLSLAVHSICESAEPGLAALGVEPVALESVLPSYRPAAAG
jgi:NADH dehydrogenase